LERAANQPSRAPTTAPIASREPARIGLRFNFEAVPWAVCLAPALAALRTTVLFNEVGMGPVYPQRAEVDLIRGLAIASLAGQAIWLVAVGAGLIEPSYSEIRKRR
jgi:hypothetical protein